MEKRTVVVLFRSVLLLAGLNAAVAQEETVDVEVGGTLSLGPKFSESISSLLWKHNGNMVVEWVKDKLDKTYGNFRNRTTMDTTNGKLEIMNMTVADAGVYTVEINKKDQGRVYNVKVLKKVPKPSIVFQPLACPSRDNCDLSCEGDTEGAEPVEYRWKTGDKEWQLKGKTLPITRVDNRHDLTFTCKMSNPVSEEESKPEANPYYKEEVVAPGNGGAIAGGIIGALILILILIAIIYAVLVYLKKLAMPSWLGRFFANDGANANVSSTGDNTKDGAAAAGGVEMGATNEQAPPTGEIAKEDSTPPAENGANSPSANSTEPDEKQPLALNEAP